jgi:hypothetical protein
VAYTNLKEDAYTRNYVHSTNIILSLNFNRMALTKGKRVVRPKLGSTISYILIANEYPLHVLYAYVCSPWICLLSTWKALYQFLVSTSSTFCLPLYLFKPSSFLSSFPFSFLLPCFLQLWYSMYVFTLRYFFRTRTFTLIASFLQSPPCIFSIPLPFAALQIDWHFFRTLISNLDWRSVLDKASDLFKKEISHRLPGEW